MRASKVNLECAVRSLLNERFSTQFYSQLSLVLELILMLSRHAWARPNLMYTTRVIVIESGRKGRESNC